MIKARPRPELSGITVRRKWKGHKHESRKLREAGLQVIHRVEPVKYHSRVRNGSPKPPLPDQVKKKHTPWYQRAMNAVTSLFR